MSQDHKERLMFELKGRKIKYCQMEMIKNTYKFIAQPILDKFANAATYLYKLAPIMAGAVNEKNIQSRFSHLADYLKKTLEVVRREPYCMEVHIVDFSYNCPDDAPYIFAHCKLTDCSYSNFEYSLSEIDSLFEKIDDFT